MADLVLIARWGALESREALSTALDQIFFEASMTQSFQSAEHRAAFRERWLGRYLMHWPQLAHLLFIGESPAPAALAGYVVGALEDPVVSGMFKDIGYYPLLAAQTRSFPAHLHINVAAAARKRGLGALLIERFVADVVKAGRPGVHVVTGANSRNVAFYRRNGFTHGLTFSWNGVENIFLGRSLSAVVDGT